jgi:hypothetical protein
MAQDYYKVQLIYVSYSHREDGCTSEVVHYMDRISMSSLKSSKGLKKIRILDRVLQIHKELTVYILSSQRILFTSYLWRPAVAYCSGREFHFGHLTTGEYGFTPTTSKLFVDPET